MAAKLARCFFCGAFPGVFFALTRCRGDPQSSSSWRRMTLPVCSRCQRLLSKAGSEGRVLKKTRDRWWLGHNARQAAVADYPDRAIGL